MEPNGWFAIKVYALQFLFIIQFWCIAEILKKYTIDWHYLYSLHRTTAEKIK